MANQKFLTKEDKLAARKDMAKPEKKAVVKKAHKKSSKKK